MALRSGLAVTLYTQINGSMIAQEIGRQLESLTFSQVSPGGFGTLNGLLRIRSARVPRPQFGIFARIAVMDGPACVWLGELLNPGYGINQSDGDYIKISALGIGNALRDDPNDWAYTNQTAQQIAQNQLSLRTGGSNNELTALISTDNSALFPDNPTNSITQYYTGSTFEEILADVSLQAGDYNWGVEADPVKKDYAGFPLGRVFARARNLTSIDYSVRLLAKDVIEAEFTPTADRAYNAIQINYANGTNGIAYARATDARLNPDLSQGSAPFRYRKYLRDLSSMSLINTTIANSITTTYLNLYQNPTYTGTARVRCIRDGNGAVMPLWQAMAGHNLFIPELAIQGQQLPSAPTQNVNLFWITQATYREDNQGTQELSVNLGYLPDSAGVQVARLQMAADALARSNRVAAVVQAVGAPMRGQYTIGFSNGIGGQIVGSAVEFPALASQAPTSLTLTSIASSNIGALSVSDLTAVGAYIYGSISANGAGYARGTYQTNGNCLLHVDGDARRFAHHCDVCDHTHQDLALDADTGHIHVTHEIDHVGLSVICPHCAGRTHEAFNLALTERDEGDRWEWRATQARLIRELMRAHGLALA